MPRSDSLRTAPDFALGLYRDTLPPLSTSRTGAGGPPQLTDRPSLHATSLTPELFQAAPESTARTAAFAQKRRARPARSLTGCSFDAAKFTYVAACSFALLASAPDSHPTLEVDFRAPLAACPGGTHTRRSCGPLLGAPLFEFFSWPGTPI